MQHAVEPTVDRGRHLLPVWGKHVQMRPAHELEVSGLRRTARVALVLWLGQRGGYGVIVGGADDQERRAITTLEVDLGRRVQVEICEPGLVEDLTGLGDRHSAHKPLLRRPLKTCSQTHT